MNEYSTKDTKISNDLFQLMLLFTEKKGKEKITKTKNWKQRKGEIKLEFILEFLKKSTIFSINVMNWNPEPKLWEREEKKRKRKGQKNNDLKIVITTLKT